MLNNDGRCRYVPSSNTTTSIIHWVTAALRLIAASQRAFHFRAANILATPPPNGSDSGGKTCMMHAMNGHRPDTRSLEVTGATA
jgi:hypothetical protein